MLRDYSDRGPEPPRWHSVFAWVGIGVVMGLILVNVLRGLMGEGWNW